MDLERSQIVTRKSALELGLKYYFTGRPCSNGHVSKRLTKSCRCSQCASGRATNIKTNRRERPCIACGAMFLGARNKAVFCSRGCATNNRPQMQWTRAIGKLKRQARWLSRYISMQCQCQYCGSNFQGFRVGIKYCSPECASRANIERTRAEEVSTKAVLCTCIQCGAAFTSHAVGRRARTKFCSAKCSALWWTDFRRRARRAGRAEPYARRDVFERDEWRCKICGESIDKSLRFPDPYCATVDHVMPIAKGGPDCLSNVQAAHLRCNSRKFTTVKEA
jgi:hypothetical protein